MKKTFSRWPIFIALLCAVITTPCFAYDLDTHFYAARLMAGYAGIGDDVAQVLATGDAWIDVEGLTNPTTHIVPRSRRLFHFLGDRRSIKGTAHGIGSLDLITEAEKDHPLASELFWEGLVQGDLLMVAGGLHPISDVEAHAGFSAEFGHGTEGHWPDRPWVEPEKYERMVRGFFQALVAIRKLLPAEALNSNFRDGVGPAHVELSADELTTKYLARADIARYIRNDVFKDPRYIRDALDFILKRAETLDVLEPGIDLHTYVAADAYSGEKNVMQVITEMTQKLIDLERRGEANIFKDGALQKVAPDLPFHRLTIDQIGEDLIVRKIVNEFVSGFIPRPFDQYHKSEFEAEGPLRRKEMDIRIGDLNDVIFSLFGQRIEFQKNTFGTKLAKSIQSFKLLLKGKAARVEHLRQEYESRLEQNVRVVTMDTPSRLRFIGKMFKFTWLDWVLGKSRFLANPDNTLYKYDEVFNQIIEEQKVKPLLSAEGYAELVERHERMQKKFQRQAEKARLAFDCEGAFI